MSGYYISQGGLRHQHYIDDTAMSGDDLWWLARRNRSYTACKWCGVVLSEHFDGQSKATYVECDECKKVGDARTVERDEPDLDTLSSAEQLERLSKYRGMK